MTVLDIILSMSVVEIIVWSVLFIICMSFLCSEEIGYTIKINTELGSSNYISAFLWSTLVPEKFLKNTDSKVSISNIAYVDMILNSSGCTHKVIQPSENHSVQVVEFYSTKDCNPTSMLVGIRVNYDVGNIMVHHESVLLAPKQIVQILNIIEDNK